MTVNQKANTLGRPAAWRLLFPSLISSFLVLTLSFSGVQAVAEAPQAAAAKPAPDVIVFKNGDQLTGTLERGVGDSVVFKSDVVGEITVSIDKIKELRANGGFVALKKQEKVTRTSKEAGKITYADNAITVASPSGAPETVPAKDLAFLIDAATYTKEVTANPGIWSGWNGTVTGGATLIRSTQDGTNLTAGLSLIRAIPSVPFLPARTRTTFDLLETYGKLTQPTIPQTTPPTPTSIAKTNIFHTDFEHDKYFSARVYALGELSFDHNFSQGLNLQQIYGGGLGWTVVTNAKQELDVKADIHYERQNFQPPTVSADLVGSTIAEMYHRTLPGKLLFTESGSIIPAWNILADYSALGTVGLQLPTYKRLAVNINASDNFLNDPAVGYKKNSFQFVTGLTYTLP